MDVSGVVFRQAQSISGDIFNNTYSTKSLFSGRSISTGKWVSGDLCFARSRDFLGVSCSGFSDNGHLQYYVSPTPTTRCGAKKEIVKEKKTIKKKLKLAKGLMKNLSAYSEMGLSEIVFDDSIGNQQEKMISISSTTELLLAQLEKLKAEEKEIKRKQKEEKAKLKALKMESKVESSSSSSESSDSDCGGQVINMNSLRTKRSTTAVLEPIVDDVSQSQSQAEIKEEKSLIISSSIVVADELKMLDQNSLRSELQCISSGISNGEVVGVEGMMMGVTVGASAERIDVCMGGKCKKLGAAALLEEFKNKVGIESAVVGCKCMGKCKSAPNVRVSSNQIEGGGGGDMSVRAPPRNNPLYIGVGLEDVSSIVANFFGEEVGEEKELGLMAVA